MRVTKTDLDQVLVVESEVYRDERGFFLEAYHRRDYAEAGIACEFVQENHSRSGRDVLRGIHYQDLTAPMAKLVRCTAGAILDVAVDLRLGSPTFARWVGVELTAGNARQLFVPVGFGHAFLVLGEAAEVQYRCSGYYAPAAEGAIRWDEGEIGIRWPIANPILSARDQVAMTLARYCQAPAFRYGARP
ncbi:MAG: dTDP-4-dehydrorhamnose 3,5-epimerase [Dehalococcoidia bacterium]|nr:dTDP-4-dehydrorhamnose 3,5-epimerase [Dehalococcoidia bacterium]